MALVRILTVCWLVEAALEDRMRTALKEPGATLPDHTGQRLQPPTACWVCQDGVGLPGLAIPGQGRTMLPLTDEHRHLLQRLGKR